MSAERPILFNGAMVRAILAGAKTQTRRAVKGAALDWLSKAQFTPEYVASPGNDLCPFGHPGDRLWVRETTEADHDTSDGVALSRYSADRAPVCYPAGTGGGFDGAIQHWRYSRESRPSIHMHRDTCRLVLEVAAVRVERLQAISEADVRAEGIEAHSDDGVTYYGPSGHGDARPEMAFRDLWNSTGGDWDSNPWVWVIEFKRVEKTP